MKEGSKGAGAGTVVLAALTGLATGALLLSLAGSRATSPADEAPSIASADVSRELRALTAELESLRMTLASQSSRTEEGMAAAPTPLRADPSEAAALQSLSEAISRLSAKLPGGAVSTPAPATPTASDAAAQRDRIGKLLDEEAVARRRRHLLWSTQQVIDTYGLPDQIEPTDSGERWYWFVQANHGITIGLHEGHVVSLSHF
jgi:hypothetical protein